MTSQKNNLKKFFVTTPIYYINDRPHIGHAYSTIAADTLARYWGEKLGKDNVLFSTGTDENSKKTIEAAKEAGQDIEKYTDTMSNVWMHTWKDLGIPADDAPYKFDFVRTSEARHKKAAQHLIQKIYDAGDIYSDKYEGPYCFRCEAFYKQEELVDGCCPVHKKEVEIVSEDNYFFDLPKYEADLKEAIVSGKLEIQPESRRNEVLAFIERGLEPISISRANQEIGVPLPFDKTQRTYVWVEALINYLTVAGYPDDNYREWWENVTHIVGKDIIKFHCIIWPAMLLSAGVDMPKRVFAHGFFTIDGEKISKSLGNAIDPVELAERYGTDALRYYLLREIPFGADGDFDNDRFAQVYKGELADNIGNLVARTLNLGYKHLGDHFDTSEESNRSPKEYHDEDVAIENLSFSYAFKCVDMLVRETNNEIGTQEPWKKIKTEPEQAKKDIIHYLNRILALKKSIKSLLPSTFHKIDSVITDNGNLKGEKIILFPRIDKED